MSFIDYEAVRIEILPKTGKGAQDRNTDHKILLISQVRSLHVFNRKS